MNIYNLPLCVLDGLYLNTSWKSGIALFLTFDIFFFFFQEFTKDKKKTNWTIRRWDFWGMPGLCTRIPMYYFCMFLDR